LLFKEKLEKRNLGFENKAGHQRFYGDGEFGRFGFDNAWVSAPSP